MLAGTHRLIASACFMVGFEESKVCVCHIRFHCRSCRGEEKVQSATYPGLSEELSYSQDISSQDLGVPSFSISDLFSRENSFFSFPETSFQTRKIVPAQRQS